MDGVSGVGFRTNLPPSRRANARETRVDRQSGWRLSPLLPASLSFSHGDGAAIVVIQVAEVGNGTVVPVIGAVP